MIDSKLLRERGGEIKVNAKNRYNIIGSSQRSDSNKEARQATVSKRSELASTNSKDILYLKLEENIKRQLKEIEERTVRASTRGKDIKGFDEKRMGVLTKALKELADIGAIPHSLMSTFKEGFEDCMRRLVTHEKIINQCLLKEIDQLKSTICSMKKDNEDCKIKVKQLEQV